MTDSKLYDKNKARIPGIVTLLKRNPDLFGKNMTPLATSSALGSFLADTSCH